MPNTAMMQNWFPHDFFALSDTNLQLFIGDEGPAGYGMYWAVVEKLYQTGSEGLSRKDITVLAKALNTSKETFEEAVGKMVENDLLFKAVNGRFYSRRVSTALERMENARKEYAASKSEAGKASGRARRGKKEQVSQSNFLQCDGLEDKKNEPKGNEQEEEVFKSSENSTKIEQNEQVLNRKNLCSTGVQQKNFVLNSNEHIRQDKTRQDRQDKTGQEKTRDDDPQTPLRGDLPEVMSSVVVPFKKPSEENPVGQSSVVVLFNGLKVRKTDLERLDSEFGKANVDRAIERLSQKAGDGLAVKNPEGIIRGLLRKMLSDGEISKPRQERPVPCPSADGTCPECGSRLHMTSTGGWEWECRDCHRRFTYQGDGKPFLEEAI